MKIIKRKLNVENFDPDKLITSIINASKDAKEILTWSDIDFIKTRVERKIKILRKDDTNTSSYEVIGVIIEVLQEYGFINILIAYLDYED